MPMEENLSPELHHTGKMQQSTVMFTVSTTERGDLDKGASQSFKRGDSE